MRYRFEVKMGIFTGEKTNKLFFCTGDWGFVFLYGTAMLKHSVFSWRFNG